MARIHDILQQHFGFSTFRAQQEEIINAVLQGHDVLALLPTGGGKSLCYQVPALAKDGLCLVISPLIALMKDQVDHLRKKNITAFSLHSGLSFYEVKQTLKAASESNCKFLYVSPERLQTNVFKEWLSSLDIQLIAVDEAHCISQWGYDFRPPYLKIAELRNQLPGIPILALTASATPDVQQDICEKLHFKKPNIFRQSFAKPNLSFSAFELPSKYNKLKEILRNVPGSALVYCKNRRRTKDIAALLLADGMAASFYNAGLTSEQRSQRQQEWIENKTRIMVCTNAFGMGIDKPDVRTVIHMDVPESPENYYQEAGRAGRDGKKAYAVLLFSNPELEDMQSLPDQKFPVMFDIRRVYQGLCNYLQIPEGIGEGQYYDFDIRVFCDRWKLEPMLVANVMKTLEQAGYIAFQENVFTPAKIIFSTTKEWLREFETGEPALDPIVKCLLRTYDGIFTNLVSVNELNMGKIIRQSVEEVTRQLHLLSAHRIIEYHPKKDSPQIYFLYNRVAKDEVVIDHKLYLKRKKQYTDRIQSMISYTVNHTQCRSEILRKYFGEKQTESCGICDACLHNKSAVITHKEMEPVIAQLKTILTTPLKLDALKLQLPGVSKAVIEKSVQWLISEELAGYDIEGRVFLKT
ncbi:MAG: ATP-dependent DNA helicase RecQ [Bacteroidota bacterium]